MEFWRKPANIKPHVYCSKACANSGPRVAQRKDTGIARPQRQHRVARTCEACGASFTVKASRVRVGWGRFCSHDCFDRSRRAIDGDGRNGGRLNRWQYRHWRKAVFLRDAFACQVCGATRTYVQAHHIRSWKDFPADRYRVENGITLCLECHRIAHSSAFLVSQA